MATQRAATTRRPATLDTPDTGQVAVLHARPVRFVDPALAAAVFANVGLPADFGDDVKGVVELPSNLPPAALWEEPGDFASGIYRGKREGVGMFQSNIYDLDVTDLDTGEVVRRSVWGGAVLDSKMDMYEPPEGSKLLIQYLGTFPAKPKQNAARNFRIRYIEG